MYGPDLTGIVRFILITILFLLFGLIYFGVKYFTHNKHMVSAKDKPTIDWILESKGKKVDTIFVYTFR